MTDTPQPKTTDEEDGMIAHADALAALAQAAFARGKKQAIAENDRRGVPSYGSDKQGRIVVRQPAAAKASADPS
jgi:hypothetical protein